MSEGSTDLATAFKHTRGQRQLSPTAESTAAQIPARYLAVLEGEALACRSHIVHPVHSHVCEIS